MRLTWLGHGGYRIEAADATILIDPWLRGNPTFDEARFDEAVAGATHILVTHGHVDHTANVPEVAQETGAEIACIIEFAEWLAAAHQLEATAFNMGGTISCAGVDVTMVRAVHSSTIPDNGKAFHVGPEAGFMLAAEGKTLYVMGDTDVHADMAIFEDLHQPDYAIVPIGGHFTMDARRAAYACKKFFNLKAAIPYHYATFPALAADADEFVAAMEGTRVIVPEVMEPFDL